MSSVNVPEILKTRFIKVGYFVARFKFKQPTAVPKIHFQGNYLKNLGFDIGAEIEIIPEAFGRLTIELKNRNSKNQAVPESMETMQGAG